MILWWFASKKTPAAEILIWRVTITVRPCFAWELTLTAPRGSGCLGHMLSSPLRALTARSPAATVNMWVPGGRKDASKRKPHCLRIQGHSICSGNKDIGKVIFNLSQGRTLWYRVRNMYVEILIYSLAASEVVNVISSGTARYGKFIGTVSVILEIYWSYNSTGNSPIRRPEKVLQRPARKLLHQDSFIPMSYISTYILISLHYVTILSTQYQCYP